MRQPERRLLLRELSSKFNDYKMITRRNWLLKCSIFANIVVLLYICSHVLVGNNTNIGMSGSGSSSYLMQQFVPTNAQQQQKTPSIPTAQMVQEEQELVAILRNKQIELQKQIGMQDVIQVRPFDTAHAQLVWAAENKRERGDWKAQNLCSNHNCTVGLKICRVLVFSSPLSWIKLHILFPLWTNWVVPCVRNELSQAEALRWNESESSVDWLTWAHSRVIFIGWEHSRGVWFCFFFCTTTSCRCRVELHLRNKNCT